jgi:HSP20 family protein
MLLPDLMPWKKGDLNSAVRRHEGRDAVLDLRRQMDSLFDDFFQKPFGLDHSLEVGKWAGDFAPRIDLSETKKAITISAELPGMEPADVEIALDRNVLTLSGEKKAEIEDKGEHHYRIERSFGSFRRSILLPAEVEESKISAKMKNGVLKVNLPKKVGSQQKDKKISIKVE